MNNREGEHSLSLIRIPEAREIRRIPVPSAHEQVVLSPDGRKAYLVALFFLATLLPCFTPVRSPVSL